MIPTGFAALLQFTLRTDLHHVPVSNLIENNKQGILECN